MASKIGFGISNASQSIRMDYSIEMAHFILFQKKSGSRRNDFAEHPLEKESQKITGILPVKSDITLQKNNDNKGEQYRFFTVGGYSAGRNHFCLRNYCAFSMKKSRPYSRHSNGKLSVNQTAHHNETAYSISSTVYFRNLSQFITSAVIFEEKL